MARSGLHKWLLWLPAILLLALTALSLAPDLVGVARRTEVADLQRNPAPTLFELSPPSAAPASEADLSLPRLETVPAEPRTRRGGAVTGLAPFNCMIEPSEVVEVGTALTAVVESIAVERSDFVEAGQLLAQLESEVESSAFETARARARMDGDVEARLASLQLGTQRHNRALRLFESNALSVDLKEETEAEAEVARAALRQARERKQLMKLNLAEAAERLERHTIRSPISGVVVELLKAPGEVVQEETILTLARLDPLRVQVVLPATMFGSIEKGIRAEVEPELPDAGVRIATVTNADAVVDAGSGTFGVRLELPNTDRGIPSGLHCKVRFLAIE